ncbi:MAG: hypothetical protein QOF87_3800 [Pseudonocardiales bacterium]|nr:hypothetical protein [Pseudonocardiales bacterium]MDT4964153.1 hypothetical protein [Pseudonocardiales bacterium]
MPSLTESIASVRRDELIGATDWCTHPTDLTVTRVRGTKNPDVAKIVALQPDLVLANKAESRRTYVDLLRAAGIAVWVTVVENMRQALESLRRMFRAGLRLLSSEQGAPGWRRCRAWDEKEAWPVGPVYRGIQAVAAGVGIHAGHRGDHLVGSGPARTVDGRRRHRCRRAGRSGDHCLPRCVEGRGLRRVPSVRGFRPLLALRGEGLLVDPVPPCTPVDLLTAEYRRWLVVDRGLAEATVLRYENLAHRFLAERASEDGGEFVAKLTGAHVVTFLLRETARVSVGAAKGRVAELRSLLRFLYVTGRTRLPLATAVPPVAGWRDTSVPVGISPTAPSPAGRPAARTIRSPVTVARPSR